MSRKYNQKEMVLRYIVALTEIKKNYLKKGRFWQLSETTKKSGIGTIPKDCLFDITDQEEITEEYVHKVLCRRLKHDASYRAAHKKQPAVAQTLFDVQQEAQPDTNATTPEVVLTEEMCIKFLKERGYSVYYRYC